jgi:hypothetical protein
MILLVLKPSPIGRLSKSLSRLSHSSKGALEVKIRKVVQDDEEFNTTGINPLRRRQIYWIGGWSYYQRTTLCGLLTLNRALQRVSL